MDVPVIALSAFSFALSFTLTMISGSLNKPTEYFQDLLISVYYSNDEYHAFIALQLIECKHGPVILFLPL